MPPQDGHCGPGAPVSDEGTWMARDRCRLVYQVWRHACAPKTLRTYPSSYRLLARDFEAAQVIRDVHAWLDERTGAA
ncbi:MAG: hypothetical protein JO015_04895 [Verrucomicrobia bacterium]|nr:hypothetical protein [Verrucomicrobiota bacterium]